MCINCTTSEDVYNVQSISGARTYENQGPGEYHPSMALSALSPAVDCTKDSNLICTHLFGDSPTY